MKFRQLTVILILLIVMPVFINLGTVTKITAQTQTIPDVYVGVDAAYPSLTANEQLVDRISSYANLLIIGSSAISRNETSLNELCQYAYNKGMSFIIYTDDARYPTQQWYTTSKNFYGNHFLGVYPLDEPGGHQLDETYKGFWLNVWSATDGQDAANKFVNNVKPWVSIFYNRTGGLPTYTSDYALYWYDYQAGFNTIFAEFGSNYSRQINVALCRGAATAQNKEWGVMITHTYTQPPYMESGTELYNDMVLAYQSGAKFIVVFDSNPDWTASILKDEHYNAMQQFWQYMQNNPRVLSAKVDRVAYVLPDYYAYGFRGPTDKIWGIWETDYQNSIAYDLSMGAGYVLMLYGNNLDMVYENGNSVYSYGYKAVILWNDSRIYQPPLPSVPTIPTPTPTLKPTPSNSPTPSPTFAPSPSPSVNVSASPTPQPSLTPESRTNLLDWFSTRDAMYAVLAGVVVVAVAVRSVTFWRKKKTQTLHSSK
jgi:hypothetical protein